VRSFVFSDLIIAQSACMIEFLLLAIVMTGTGFASEVAVIGYRLLIFVINL
jgi:hypothetical protein